MSKCKDCPRPKVSWLTGLRKFVGALAGTEPGAGSYGKGWADAKRDTGEQLKLMLKELE